MALKDVIIGYAKGDKGDKGDIGERGATGQTGPQGEPGNIADAAITDTQGLDVAKGAKTTAQKLFDAIADRIVNKLVTNDTLTTKLADYLLKSAMSSTNINSTTNVPTSALVYSLLQDVNNNLSKRLLVGNNIASADLSNDMPDERFGTLSMRFSDGTINQLILLKDTANVSIFKDNKWIEQYRFATTSMLSDYVPKSDLVASSSDIQSKQNITDSSNIKFYKYGKIVVAHIQITTTSNLSGYDTLKVGVAPNGFKPLYECRSVVLMQQTNVSRILAFTTYGDINLWNWSSDSSITTPSGSALNGFAVYCVA